jgi:hypothetical protein
MENTNAVEFMKNITNVGWHLANALDMELLDGNENPDEVLRELRNARVRLIRTFTHYDGQAQALLANSEFTQSNLDQVTVINTAFMAALIKVDALIQAYSEFQALNTTGAVN